MTRPGPPTGRDGRPTFAHDARWSLGIVVARAGASLVFVLAASRSLGSSGFGTLAALSALTSMALVLTSSGVAWAATMFASRSSDGAGAVLAAGLRAAAWSVAVVGPAYLVVVRTVLPDAPLAAAAALFTADVLVVGVAELAASVSIGLHEYRRATAVWGTLAGGRAVAGIVVALSSPRSLTAVTVVAVLAAVAVVPILIALARPLLGRPGPPAGASGMVRAGAVFAAGSLVGRANNDFDKVYLSARLGAAESVGTYAAGYRIVEYAMLPLTALTTAAAPRLFRAGTGGVARARRVTGRLSMAYVGTGAALAVALLAGRGVIEAVFGPTYEGLSSVVAMLALLPLLRAVANVLAEPLTGGGRHRVRVLILGLGLAVNVVVNVSLLDSLGWRAAVWGTYASEATQLVVLAMIALAARRPKSATRRRLSSVGDARQ